MSTSPLAMGLSIGFGAVTLAILWRQHRREPLSRAARTSLIVSTIFYALAAVVWAVGILGHRFR